MASARTSYARCIAMASAMLTAALLLLASAAPAAPGSEKVLIGFRGRPDTGALRALGARILHAYDLVPAVAAEVPSGRLSAIRALKGVLYVEPDYPIYATGPQGARLALALPAAGDAKPLSVAVVETLPWGIERIGAPEVWLGTPELPGNRGTGVAVAILDTGIDYTHPDLADNYVSGYDFVNDDYDPLDDNGHGTHVAGTIAARDDGPNSGGGNTTGISVVGVGPEISLYVAKILNREGSGSTSDAVAALNVAARYGMQVVNMSFGSPFSSTTMKSACGRASAAGIVLVAAAGNEAAPWLDAPARYPSVISVGATNSLDQHVAFSNTSKNLELCAPGVAVLSTMPTYTVRLNQYPYGYQTYYDYLDGTSMAAPHVSGAAALVIAAHPDWSNSQVRSRLRSTATDLGASGRDSYFGYGLVNAAAAAQ